MHIVKRPSDVTTPGTHLVQSDCLVGANCCLNHVSWHYTQGLIPVSLLTASYSVFVVVHGVRDLFWMPIEQYRKDGRIIRGLQRGAASFGTSTASAALELSNRLVQAIQVCPRGHTGAHSYMFIRVVPVHTDRNLFPHTHRCCIMSLMYLVRNYIILYLFIIKL